MDSLESVKTKVCRKCDDEKPVTEFYRKSDSRDGYKSECKACMLAHQSASYKENPGKLKENQRRYYLKNKAKINERHRRLRRENPAKIKEWNNAYREKLKKDPDAYSRLIKQQNLRNKYKISYDEYQNMKTNQGGLCAIGGCGRPSKDVDHCHETHVVRGLLCGPCNRAIGLLDENIDRLHGIIRYLIEA